jgi:hypothetical protein
MQRLLIAIFLLIAASVHVFTLRQASDAMKEIPQDAADTFVIPSPILKIMALEFRGLASDILFLKSLAFIGGTQQRKEPTRVQESEWNWFIKVLNASTDLDPYFLDPYYYANAFLTWDAGRVEEANRLLEKGSRYRDWDWMLPFFIGFNDFFFLQNDSKAAEFLMEASRRPGGDPMLASIASRLAYKENRTETAIYFLEDIARRTNDNTVKESYEKRIRALRSIDNLEKAVSLFKNKFGRTPLKIEELVSKNLVSQLPRDPYGGNYFIDEDGKVRSTTSSELEPYFSPSQNILRR